MGINDQADRLRPVQRLVRKGDSSGNHIAMGKRLWLVSYH